MNEKPLIFYNITLYINTKDRKILDEKYIDGNITFWFSNYTEAGVMLLMFYDNINPGERAELILSKEQLELVLIEKNRIANFNNWWEEIQIKYL